MENSVSTERKDVTRNAAFRNCLNCQSTGKCPPCKATGRSGYFLREPPPTARPCWRCKGSGICLDCGGKGVIAEPAFEPYIFVAASNPTPSSISIAAIAGTGWRRIVIPRAILRRTSEAQRGWVSWRVRKHYKENGGKCFLFGDIVSYVWTPSPGAGIRFDIKGKIVPDGAMPNQTTAVGTGSIGFRNKTFSVEAGGRVRIGTT